MLIIDHLNILPVRVDYLEFEAGITALSAPSGTGKSRIFQAIADLIVNQAEVSLDGNKRDDMPATQWRKMVRYVSAEPAWWGATARDHMPQNKQVSELAKQFGLAEKLFDSPIDQLSTGEKQRFGLIRALADDPQVLLLDEPTAALDEASCLKVEAELLKRAAAGNVIFLTSHSDAQIKRIASRVLTIKNGLLQPVDIGA